MDIDDFIDWGVPFINEENSNYPISCFRSLMEESFKKHIPNKKLENIIKKIKLKIIKNLIIKK